MDSDWIPLSIADLGAREAQLVAQVMGSGRLSGGPMVEAFESVFADLHARKYAVAVSSGMMGAWLALRALGIGPGDEVIASAYSWHHVANAIVHAGATPVLADIDYWSGAVAPQAVADAITPRTRAILANNCNGHPAAWAELRALADRHAIALIEDSTEAIGSRYMGQLVGTFGDMSIFDFSQPLALNCGEGGMVLTDDAKLASELRYLRSHALADRNSVSVGSRVPLAANMSDIAAAIGIAQAERIDEIHARRKQVEVWYHQQMQTFEGIKPPYLAQDVDEVHWMLYVVHLGKRFTLSARAQLVEDLDTEAIEVAAYCRPLHHQFHYQQYGYKRGQLKNTDRIGDRSLALPFHGFIEEDEVRFVVKTLKDAATNVGAGAAIY
ncbi:DegT/DnrJ/EryC1/StrS family aminotransferase [Methyloversatilis sp. XJ19-13]|jgi:dTDP-4-amino-4,6-dideoxygalactose transaminase|uniref:DegT/DnrJ/EryC1/StrS family aminotransferase n=1 Tax=Methyloversatilis sp. XJ19-13 TaxID=2963430 RepID=UPI00211C0988|nr:DegT/DnrJ/EryC1/StrS family aminotransferase [Methyloversatilis sp. XJ19-13]MCQ9372754.1 DegT/DnrJ/EryC1/StrS family aminotransferase [Methyloversatilis sp. XJ19-13]